MTFAESVKTCFRKYFDFRGRATRSEFWWLQLFMLIVGLALGVLDSVIFGSNGFIDWENDFTIKSDIGISIFPDGLLESIFDFATFIPSISVSARRLHDIGKTGWWQCVPLAGVTIMAPGIYLFFVGGASDFGAYWLSSGALIAFTLFIMLIVWYCRDSERGANRYGESSKYSSVGETFS